MVVMFVCFTIVWSVLNLIYYKQLALSYKPWMKQIALKNVKIVWMKKLPFFSETSGGQNSNLHLNFVQFLMVAYDYHFSA